MSAQHQATILHVEDDLAVLAEFKEILKMRYPVVLSAKNGKEALSIIESTTPDVVIADIQMPVMDGLVMIEEIRKSHPNLPVIITSAHNDTSYLLRAIDLGVNHYITKPINAKKLLDMVDEILTQGAQERKIAEQNRLIYQVINQSPNPTIAVKNDKIEFANRSFLELFGAQNPQSLPENIAEQIVCGYQDNRRFGSLKEWIAYLLDEKCPLHTLSIANRVYRPQVVQSESFSSTIISLSDVTELESARKNLAKEAELSQNELEHYKKMLEIQSRMAQMGEMIGAIAHQWKQPLTVLGMSLDIIKYELSMTALEKDSRLQEYITQAQNQVRYMSETINDFRGFFSPSKKAHPFTLDEAIKSIMGMVGRQYQSNGIVFILEGDINTKIIGYPNEFKQALINLINNAQDAFIERGIKERKIKIEAKESQDKITIAIEDTAGGIQNEALPQIFNPFFTTKGEKGTGIGLHLVKLIIEESHKGSITAHNGEFGARFVITLPLNVELSE